MNLISALLGVIIGILGTWISYRNRVSPQREILYAKQSEIYTDVLRKAHGIYFFALRYLNASDDERKKVQDDILRDYLEFTVETAEIGGIAPTGVYLAYGDFSGLLGSVCNPNNPNYGKATQSDLVKSYYQLLNSIRRSMGVDSLTEESMSLYRKPTDTRDYLDLDFFHEELKNVK